MAVEGTQCFAGRASHNEPLALCAFCGRIMSLVYTLLWLQKANTLFHSLASGLESKGLEVLSNFLVRSRNLENRDHTVSM